MPAYFDNYINMCDDVELLEAIKISIEEIRNFPLDKWKSLGDNVYAPGKWTIKDILQHIIDTDRIFSYRALAFARGETQQVPSFDEDTYAAEAKANLRSLESIVDELLVVRQSLLAMFQSFTPEMLKRSGNGFKGPYSVASVGFCMAGHQRWHIKVIEERYYPLLSAVNA